VTEKKMMKEETQTAAGSAPGYQHPKKR